MHTVGRINRLPRVNTALSQKEGGGKGSAGLPRSALRPAGTDMTRTVWLGPIHIMRARKNSWFWNIFFVLFNPIQIRHFSKLSKTNLLSIPYNTTFSRLYCKSVEKQWTRKPSIVSFQHIFVCICTNQGGLLWITETTTITRTINNTSK